MPCRLLLHGSQWYPEALGIPCAIIPASCGSSNKGCKHRSTTRGPENHVVEKIIVPIQKVIRCHLWTPPNVLLVYPLWHDFNPWILINFGPGGQAWTPILINFGQNPLFGFKPQSWTISQVLLLQKRSISDGSDTPPALLSQNLAISRTLGGKADRWAPAMWTSTSQSEP